MKTHSLENCVLPRKRKKKGRNDDERGEMLQPGSSTDHFFPLGNNGV
jgi:hypothetical protein